MYLNAYIYIDVYRIMTRIIYCMPPVTHGVSDTCIGVDMTFGPRMLGLHRTTIVVVVVGCSG
jgi:hypothetical protein